MSIKLTYFDINYGRGEVVRLALAVGGIPFEDHRVDGATFGQMRAAGKIPFKALPMATIEGKVYNQTTPLVRYLGKKADLYPEDALDAMRVDEMLDAMEDVVLAAFADSSPEGRAKFVNESIPRYYGAADKIMSETPGPYLLGSKMTVADLKIHVITAMLHSKILDHVPSNAVDQYLHMNKCWKEVGRHPKVMEWRAAH